MSVTTRLEIARPDLPTPFVWEIRPTQTGFDLFELSGYLPTRGGFWQSFEHLEGAMTAAALDSCIAIRERLEA